MKGDEHQDAPRREIAALQLLSALDVAPQPIFYDAALGPMVIFEFLDTTMWDRTGPTTLQLLKFADLTLTFNDRIQYYLPLFYLLGLLGLLNDGVSRAEAANSLTDWQSNGLSVNIRLRRYLAKAQAWPAKATAAGFPGQAPLFPKKINYIDA